MFGSRLSDDELMAKVALGENKAFARLFDRHAGKFLGYATRLLGNPTLAEDLTQEVWVKIVKLAPSYQGNGHFVAWAYTIIRNGAFNELRSRKKWQNSVPTDGEEGQQLPDSTDLEIDLIDKKQKELVYDHLGKLPEPQRVALTTWLTEDLSYEQIAEAMTITVPAVKSLLHRAKKQLEDSIKGEQ